MLGTGLGGVHSMTKMLGIIVRGILPCGKRASETGTSPASDDSFRAKHSASSRP